MNKMMSKKKNNVFILWMIFGIVLTILPVQNAVVWAEEEKNTIRIGYDTNSNFIKESNGEYYGYGIEYLNKIADYTDWEYEYVKDSSWHESMDKLKNGEIDLLCTAHHTEERAKDFLYADIPLGYETTLLYVSTDSEISYQDYDAINGCKVGLLSDSYSAEDFQNYMTKNNINCETQYFERENDMLTALNSGSIDMIAIGSRYGTNELKMVDRLGANAFYCITNKENEILIKQIEEILQQIKFDNPEFEGELNAKYFGHHLISEMPLYTKEELEYIANADVIKVKVMMNQRPSCYTVGDEVKGIWVGYIELLAEKSGIEFDIEVGGMKEISEESYNELIEDGYLLLRSERSREYNNRVGDNLTTIPLSEIKLSYFQLKEEFVDNSAAQAVVGITGDLKYIEPLLLEEHAEYQFVYYDRAEDVLEALLNNEVDMVVQNAYWASYLMQKPEYVDKITEVPGPEYNNNILLVGSEENAVLIEILNKAINHISDAEREEIVKRELLMNPYPLSLGDIWYQYWEWIVGVGIICILGIGAYTVMTHRMTALAFEKKEFELLQKRIKLDELTGLYNRSYFYEMANELIHNSDEEMCIVTMDISNFKVVNELYGINAGDRLLKEVAEQVLKLEGDREFLPSRFMADHYYMCMPRSEFERISLPKSFKTFLEDMDVKVTYGVFFIEDQTDMPVNVMCDRAALAAHDKHYRYVEYVHFYNDSIRREMMEEQEIEKDMEKALAEKQFYIVVQPKFNGLTKKIIGGEVLVRWQHPEKGIISPGVFIKVFEKNGFIVHLDYFVWEETCRLLAKQNEAGISMPLSINVSRAHFYGKELKHKLLELIETYHIPAEQLELEITESIYGEDPEVIYDMIRELREVGFKIAMDDFGSGYSSLNMLKEIPLDILKMDLKFLDGEESKSRLILGSLIKLAQAMELKVVVEGVEIESQVEFLNRFKGCYLQGYYFSRPVIQEVYEEMITKQ